MVAVPLSSAVTFEPAPDVLQVMELVPEPNLRRKPAAVGAKVIVDVPLPKLLARPLPVFVKVIEEVPEANLRTSPAPLVLQVQVEVPLSIKTPTTNSTLSVAVGRSAQSVDCGETTDKVEEPIHLNLSRHPTRQSRIQTAPYC